MFMKFKQLKGTKKLQGYLILTVFQSQAVWPEKIAKCL